MSQVTRILEQIEQGDGVAAAQLLPLVYDELRRLASEQMAGEKPGQTLDATALVHEAYLRLVMSPQREQGYPESLAGAAGSPEFANRRHFFAAAAEAMRRILIESARRKHREKHGGEMMRHELDQLELAGPRVSDDLLALDEALQKLKAADAVAAQLVDLRYFAGMTIPQAAELMNLSPRTADRLWAYARAFLHSEVYGEQ